MKSLTRSGVDVVYQPVMKCRASLVLTAVHPQTAVTPTLMICQVI